MTHEADIKITDYDSRLLSLLLAQFKDKPNFEKFIRAFAAEVQSLEDEIFRFYHELALDQAVGEQLDGIGEILGEERKGRSDSEYRAFLSVRITINVSRGEPETMISVLAAITGSTYVNLVEAYPARIEMYFNGLDIPSTLLENMSLIKPAGVALALLFNGGQTPFVFSGDADGLGFSDVGFDTGGAMVEVYT